MYTIYSGRGFKIQIAIYTKKNIQIFLSFFVLLCHTIVKFRLEGTFSHEYFTLNMVHLKNVWTILICFIIQNATFEEK